MPTYEKYKYCSCGEIAEYECNCNENHPDEIEGWAEKPKYLADHNKWVCDTCLEDAEK